MRRTDPVQTVSKATAPLHERRMWLFIFIVEALWLAGLGYVLSLLGS